MPDEVELKLEVSSEGLDALTHGIFGGEPRIARQVSTYFDTPKHDLHSAGFSLRIRRIGRVRVQTVKAKGAEAAGLFVRPEWERKVRTNQPVLDDHDPVGAVLGKKADDLAGLFATNVERQTWDLAEGDTSIEVALDRGEIVADDRRTPLCEVELEQKTGSPAALFALARRIDAVAPVRVGVLSKCERGYRLLGQAQGAIKAEPILLERGTTAAVAFQHIARACLRQFRLNEAVLLEQRNTEALHQARVALRRLRSAFSIHRAMLEDDRFDRLSQELRWLATQLGDARNLDALIERVAPGPVRDAIEQARGQAYDTVETVLRSDRERHLMIDLIEWIAFGDWLRQPDTQTLRDQPARRFAARALDRFRRKIKDNGRNLADLDDEERHQVRKAAKKLRYTAEFFTALYDRKGEKRPRKRFIAALEELQDHLGALNDLAVAPAILTRLGLADLPETAALCGAGRKSDLLGLAAAARHRLIDTKRFWT
jgi:inorganic triphosphatase YgiF